MEGWLTFLANKTERCGCASDSTTTPIARKLWVYFTPYSLLPPLKGLILLWRAVRMNFLAALFLKGSGGNENDERVVI